MWRWPLHEMAVSLLNDWIYGSFCQCFDTSIGSWVMHCGGNIAPIENIDHNDRWQVLFCETVFFFFMLPSFWVFVCFCFAYVPPHTFYQCYIIQSVPFCVTYTKNSLLLCVWKIYFRVNLKYEKKYFCYDPECAFWGMCILRRKKVVTAFWNDQYTDTHIHFPVCYI